MRESHEEVGARESHEEAVEEWAGRVERMEGVWLTKRCTWSGGYQEKRKTETGGLCEERFGRSGRGGENDGEV